MRLHTAKLCEVITVIRYGEKQTSKHPWVGFLAVILRMVMLELDSQKNTGMAKAGEKEQFCFPCEVFILLLLK